MIAIIDCGTNTFAMSIFKLHGKDGFARLYKERHYVDLAEEGSGSIGAAAFERALGAFRKFRHTLNTKGVTELCAVGTAALRDAANSIDLVTAIAAETGISIEIIDGQREADLIYQGVRLASPTVTSNALIIDIGGGSTEFILCNNEQVLWAQSFPLGATLLYHKIGRPDPIENQQIWALEACFEKDLQPLSDVLSAHPSDMLIGASGTFDALNAVLGRCIRPGHYNYIALEEMYQLHQKLLPTTYAERICLPSLPKSRAKLIVIALLLVEWVVRKANIQTPLVASDYALKEGKLWELLSSRLNEF